MQCLNFNTYNDTVSDIDLGLNSRDYFCLEN